MKGLNAVQSLTITGLEETSFASRNVIVIQNVSRYGEVNGEAEFYLAMAQKIPGGICILFKKDFFCNISNITVGEDGRYIICELNTGSGSANLTLCTVYAPNQDKPEFFKSLFHKLGNYCERKNHHR